MSNLRYTRESFLSGIYHTRLARKGKRRRAQSAAHYLYLRKMFTALRRCRPGGGPYVVKGGSSRF